MTTEHEHQIERFESQKVKALGEISNKLEKIWAMLVLLFVIVLMAAMSYLGNLHSFFKNWVS